MKPRILYSIVVLSILLLAVNGCRRTSSVPVTNPPGVETSLASTARALAKQTEVANSLNTTPSPTPTDTPIPTPEISLQGTSLTVWEDQTALFTDQKAGIYLTIPAGWMPFRVNEKEYYDAFTAEVILANPALNDHLIQVQSSEPSTFRLDAFDIREGHIVNGVISDMTVTFHAGDMRSLEEWSLAEGRRKKPSKNYWLIYKGYTKTEDDTRVLRVEEEWSKDENNKIYHRAVFISLPTGTLVLDLYTNKEFKDTVLPDFEKMVNSITLLEP